MANRIEKEDQGLMALMNTMAESVLEMSDEDVLRQSRDDGEDVTLVASGVRSVLLDAVKLHRQSRLYEALAEYKEQLKAFRSRAFPLPSKADERRELLASVFSRFPQMQNTFLTVQHRDFKNFSDADIESFLKQLQALGVLGQN